MPGLKAMPNDHGTKPDLKAGAEVGRRELVGRELAHVASLLLLKFSVRLFVTRTGFPSVEGCGKEVRGAFLPRFVPWGSVAPSFRKLRK
jgi:hypothetical protein